MSGDGCSETSGGWVEARVRAAGGDGGGKCRAGWETRREVGLERRIGGRRGGIGLMGWWKDALWEDVRTISEGQRKSRLGT